VALINRPNTTSSKRAALVQLINTAVDVDEIARFGIGRFWNTATPDQHNRYMTVFREALVTNIVAKFGDYRGVRFTMSSTHSRDDGMDVVSTIVERPNNPPAKFDWIVRDAATRPKIVDLVVEGVSLRITQRSDYTSYLTHHQNSVHALIDAIHRQIGEAV
jgi:phospholipid transport system substrate-binding protein